MKILSNLVLLMTATSVGAVCLEWKCLYHWQGCDYGCVNGVVESNVTEEIQLDCTGQGGQQIDVSELIFGALRPFASVERVPVITGFEVVNDSVAEWVVLNPNPEDIYEVSCFESATTLGQITFEANVTRCVSALSWDFDANYGCGGEFDPDNHSCENGCWSNPICSGYTGPESFTRRPAKDDEPDTFLTPRKPITGCGDGCKRYQGKGICNATPPPSYSYHPYTTQSIFCLNPLDTFSIPMPLHLLDLDKNPLISNEIVFQDENHTTGRSRLANTTYTCLKAGEVQYTINYWGLDYIKCIECVEGQNCTCSGENCETCRPASVTDAPQTSAPTMSPSNYTKTKTLTLTVPVSVPTNGFDTEVPTTAPTSVPTNGTSAPTSVPDTEVPTIAPSLEPTSIPTSPGDSSGGSDSCSCTENAAALDSCINSKDETKKLLLILLIACIVLALIVIALFVHIRNLKSELNDKNNYKGNDVLLNEFN